MMSIPWKAHVPVAQTKPTCATLGAARVRNSMQTKSTLDYQSKAYLKRISSAPQQHQPHTHSSIRRVVIFTNVARKFLGKERPNGNRQAPIRVRAPNLDGLAVDVAELVEAYCQYGRSREFG